MFTVLIIFLVIGILALAFFARSKTSDVFKLTPNQLQGICYFDIDGTLTTAEGDSNEIIQACLDKNYGVGIITASARTPEMICNGPKSKVGWMPNKLCSWMHARGYDTFNSNAPMVAGMTRFNPKFPKESLIIDRNAHWPIELGKIKGTAMNYGAKLLGIKDKSKVILFDDDPCFAKGVKEIDPNLKVVCAGSACSLTTCEGTQIGDGSKRLTLDLV